LIEGFRRSLPKVDRKVAAQKNWPFWDRIYGRKNNGNDWAVPAHKLAQERFDFEVLPWAQTVAADEYRRRPDTGNLGLELALPADAGPELPFVEVGMAAGW
jgi:hypothetical protein